MSRTYRYIKINDYFFCLQQNPLVLAWILFLKREDLHAIYTPWIKKNILHGIIPYIEHGYGIFLNNLKILGMFSMCRYNLRAADSFIDLQFYGHLCKHVHKGYKIFNLINDMVIKVFDADVKRDSIVVEIERLQIVSQIEFAPALGKGNAEEGWYEEEYIVGSTPLFYKSQDSTVILSSFKSEIIPCLNGLMQYKQSKSINTLHYINNLRSKLEVSRSSMHKSDIPEADKIMDFVSSMVERINNEGSQNMYLVFSHGDFCPANMLSTKKGIRILDWENASYRSVLFDFYSYFFYRSVCIYLPIDNMVNEINKALPLFISKVSIELSAVSESLSNNGVIYRWTFYIEYICKLLERKMTDNNLNISDFIFRYIEAFNRYEETIAGCPGFKKRKTDALNTSSISLSNIKFT